MSPTWRRPTTTELGFQLLGCRATLLWTTTKSVCEYQIRDDRKGWRTDHLIYLWISLVSNQIIPWTIAWLSVLTKPYRVHSRAFLRDSPEIDTFWFLHWLRWCMYSGGALVRDGMWTLKQPGGGCRIGTSDLLDVGILHGKIIRTLKKRRQRNIICIRVFSSGCHYWDSVRKLAIPNNYVCKLRPLPMSMEPLPQVRSVRPWAWGIPSEPVRPLQFTTLRRKKGKEEVNWTRAVWETSDKLEPVIT